MGLFSFITLTAFSMHQTKALVSMETASWYDKKGELTFSDIIAIVRRSIWSNKYFSKSENQLDLYKCSKESINSLIYQLTLSAWKALRDACYARSSGRTVLGKMAKLESLK